MRALLDVNVLIALLDAEHVSHSRALAWFTEFANGGWASCPITQNGCIRIMSSPGYPNPIPVRSVIERLGAATRAPQHEFWPDSVSLLDAGTADAMRIHGPRQLTDVYLIALAVSRSGRFVTFDSAIPREAAKVAERRHILVL